MGGGAAALYKKDAVTQRSRTSLCRGHSRRVYVKVRSMWYMDNLVFISKRKYFIALRYTAVGLIGTYRSRLIGDSSASHNIFAMNCVFLLPPPRVAMLSCGPRVHAIRADALRHAPHMRTSNSLRQHHLMPRVPKMSRITSRVHIPHVRLPPGVTHAVALSFPCHSSVPMARGIQVSFQCHSSDTDGERHSDAGDQCARGILGRRWLGRRPGLPQGILGRKRRQ